MVGVDVGEEVSVGTGVPVVVGGMVVCAAVGGDIVDVGGTGVAVEEIFAGVATGAQPAMKRSHPTSSERNL